ncbi:unnamed protein product, partial [Laminaria digitata]
ALARQLRYYFLNRCGESGAIIYPSHFTGTEIGKIVSQGEGWRFDFVSE